MDDLTGKTIGRYQVSSLIGRGGMATVYKAHDPSLDRAVALKLLLPQLSADPAFVARFRREARAVAALRHPNIVQVHEFDSADGEYFMVMEFVDGPTLATLLKRLNRKGRRLSREDILRIFPPLCSAIDYANREGMVHRDIKPSNIILTRKGDPVVTDYGIAKVAGATSYTMPGTVVGSAQYMSPEQAQGLPADNRSDIYSLGVCLFEALTGRVPFDGETTASVLAQHLTAPVPSALAFNPELPLEVEAVLARVLARNPPTATSWRPIWRATWRPPCSRRPRRRPRRRRRRRRLRSALPRRTRSRRTRGAGRAQAHPPGPSRRRP